MKNILYSLIVGLSSVASSGNEIYAQNASRPLKTDFNKAIRQVDAMEFPATAGAYIPDAKYVNLKAVIDFESRFINVSDTKWFFTIDGFEAFFVKAGTGNRAFYDKKGKWVCSVISYNENRLPCDLRNQIRSTYYDMTISLVQEIQNPDHSIYIVTLQDKSTRRVLKINQECERTVLQKLAKK